LHISPTFSCLDWHGLGRRRFLRVLTTIGTASAIGPLISACSSETSGSLRLLVLSAAQASTLAALAQAVVPSQKGFPTVAQAEVVQRMDEELWLSDSSIQDDMRAALEAMEWLPLVYGHLTRFSALTVAQRQTLVSAWMESRFDLVRAIATNLKLVAHFMYFGHSSAWAAIGYDGPFQKLPPIQSEQRKAYAMRVAGGAQ
jgi:hypothetical protein